MQQKKKFCSVILSVILLTALVAGFGKVPARAAGASGSEEKPKLIQTELIGEGRKVTLQVTIGENSQVTSGRVKIYYPTELLDLAGTEEGKLWELEDTNTKLTEDGKVGISYAWTDMEKQQKEGNLLTVTWEAGEEADGQEIVIETEIAELFSQEKKLADGSGKIADKLRLDFGDSGSTGSQNAENQSADAGVRTGDNSSMAGYVLLCLGAVLVMARAVRKKKG